MPMEGRGRKNKVLAVAGVGRRGGRSLAKTNNRNNSNK